MARQARNAAATCAALLVLLAPGFADDSTAARPAALLADWPDSFVARVEALALLQTLNAELLSHDSATSTLEQWCASHHLASPPRILAERLSGADHPPTEAQRGELGVSATEPVRYRHVQLRCGAVLLSEADNWYVPARLTPDMNRLLDTTDTPFGRAVQSLHFQRHTISARLLWLPLPEDWDMNPAAVGGSAAGSLIVPADVLQHRALLTLPNGIPISEVVETYSGNVLAFPHPPPAP
jgi:chorismate-pyruvate lyase